MLLCEEEEEKTASISFFHLSFSAVRRWHHPGFVGIIDFRVLKRSHHRCTYIESHETQGSRSRTQEKDSWSQSRLRGLDACWSPPACLKLSLLQVIVCLSTVARGPSKVYLMFDGLSLLVLHM